MDFNNHETYSNIIPQINEQSFDFIALKLFRFQYQFNPIYKSFVDALNINPENISQITDIPFLPISFFKTHQVITGNKPPDQAPIIFQSSGTTQTINSQHFIFHPEIYETAFINGFQQTYGNPQDHIFLALLPSYIERNNSSLVYMTQKLMTLSNHPANGFYLNEWNQLATQLQQLLKNNTHKIILLGVTFALLDFADAFPMPLHNTIVMETGGMKGRREEMTRKQVHNILKTQWQIPQIHSEYGMTELLSQAYAQKDGIFHPTPTLKALIRDINDPLTTYQSGNGCLNVIDLANIESCAFIATEDLGSLHQNGTFQVNGRLDHAALRGCSLMTL